jgi:uncharacterized protein
LRHLPDPAASRGCARGRAFEIAGIEVVADPTGSLYLPGVRALVVADMHLEKGSHFAARGQMLPPYDTGATLAHLADAIEHYAPAAVLALGDSFHDETGYARLGDRDRLTLAALQRGRDWIWIAGNHDPFRDETIGGSFSCEERIGPLALRHLPSEAPAFEIAGHLHPVASLTVRDHLIRRRCFVHDESRIVMPAFGTLTGGLDVRSAVIQKLFQPDTIRLQLVSRG